MVVANTVLAEHKMFNAAKITIHHWTRSWGCSVYHWCLATYPSKIHLNVLPTKVLYAFLLSSYRWVTFVSVLNIKWVTLGWVQNLADKSITFVREFEAKVEELY